MSYYLANYLVELDQKVVFYSHRHTCQESVKRNLIIIPCKYPTDRMSIRLLYHMMLILLRYKPDVVISHFSRGKLFMILSKLLYPRVRIFYYYHTLIKQMLFDHGIRKMSIVIEKFIRKNIVNINLANSIKSSNELINFWGCENVIRHYTPLPDRYVINYSNSTSHVRISNHKLKLGFIGRIENSKGIKLLINLFETNVILKDKIKLIICGPDYHKLMNIKSDAYAYNGELTYNKIDDFIQSCDAIIIPSLIDNLNYVGIETLMNQQLLLISTQTGLANELEEGVNCLKFIPNNLDLIRCLEKWIKLDDVEADSIKVEGRRLYEDKFTNKKYNEFMTRLIHDYCK